MAILHSRLCHALGSDLAPSKDACAPGRCQARPEAPSAICRSPTAMHRPGLPNNCVACATATHWRRFMHIWRTSPSLPFVCCKALRWGSSMTILRLPRSSARARPALTQVCRGVPRMLQRQQRQQQHAPKKTHGRTRKSWGGNGRPSRDRK